MIDELLVSFLRSQQPVNDIAKEIAVGETPTNADGKLLIDTYIWISNFDEEDKIDLCGETGLTRYHFDIECCSTDTLRAKRLGRAVKKALQGYGPGKFGQLKRGNNLIDGFVDAVFFESKDDDYVPVNQFDDDNFVTVVAMDIEIIADDAQDDL